MQFWIILLDPSNRFRRMRRLLYILPTVLCVSAHRVGTHGLWRKYDIFISNLDENKNLLKFEL